MGHDPAWAPWARKGTPDMNEHVNEDRHDSDASGAATHGSATHDAGQGASQDAKTGTHAGQERTFTEEFRVSGERVVAKVKELIHEGNVRRISLKNDEGKTLIEIPLTVGVIGTALLPVWAGIGAIAALVANLTITVEKVAPKNAPSDAADATADAAGAPPADAPQLELPSA